MIESTPGEMLKELLLSLQAAGIDYLPYRGEIREAAPRASVRPPAVPTKPAIPAAQPPRTALPPEAPKPIRPVPKPPAAKPSAPPPPTGRLELLAGDVALCQRCPELGISRTRTLFGEGKVQPFILFLGDAPSADEDASGRLFVGPIGELFDKIMAACRLSRDDIYLTNLIKCRPPGKRGSKPEECENCRGYLNEQLDLVQPVAICCLGEVVGRRLLGSNAAMAELRAGSFTYRNRPVYCTHHPREFVGQPKDKEEIRKAVWNDLKRMLAELGRPVG